MHQTESIATHDLLLCGGGLQNGLIAVACAQRDPQLRIALIERGAALGGNHIWSLQLGELAPAERALADSVIAQRWPGYEVRFPQLRRRLAAPYASITTESLNAAVARAFERRTGSRLLLQRTVQRAGPDHVQLEDGERLRAALVIDARGPDVVARDASVRCGYQKFLGLELELAAEHGLREPILMDATVAQSDGFRFFYVLPLGARRLLVEDTAFSREPELDHASARRAVLAYAERFAPVTDIAREEHGVLPMPWSGTPSAPIASPLAAGYQGGWFHPATGYSLPVALRLACHVAAHAPDRVLGSELRALQRSHRSQVRFAQALNRLLFHGFAPAAMWNVFERFYRLPEAVIARFYALASTPLDQARIVLGRPPRGFSLGAALGSAAS